MRGENLQAAVLGLAAALLAACGEDPERVTFNRDIAPIVFANCSGCHRPGESAPFDLLTYRDARKHARQMVRVTQSRLMPPWLPEPGEFELVGRRGLGDEEIALLSRWVDEGMVEGNARDLPAPPQYVDGWRLGEPDLILRMPEPFELVSSGTEVFRNFVIPIPVSEVRYVRAVELRPGNKQVVHHAVMAVDRTAASRRLDARDAVPGFDGMDMGSAVPPDGHFLGWTPGKVPFHAREGMAWRLAPGTDLVVQLHLVPSGKPEPVQVSVGLFFVDEPPRFRPSLLMLADPTLDIPAGVSEYVAQDSFELPVAVDLLGIYPHAHYLGKDLWGFATLPDGEKRTLLRIRNWDLNWQDEYRYAEPIALPAGTTLTMRYTYDNSEGNVRNPSHPPVRVRHGPQSTDEMGTLMFQVLVRDERERIVLEREKALHTLRRTPADGYARNRLGSALVEDGRIAEAVAEFREALRLEPDLEEARYNLGIALVTRGEIDEGIRQFREALRVNPDFADAHNNLGNALLALGRLDEAATHLRRAIEIRFDFGEAHYNLGTVYLTQGRMDPAIEQFREALRIDPHSSMTFSNLGAAVHSQGQVEEALRLYQQALRLDPGNAEAHNNLGLALSERGLRDEAIEHFRTALELRPGFILARENLDKLLR